MQKRSRRDLLKILGVGATTSAVMGMAAGESENDSKDGDASPSGPSVEPDALTDWSTTWSPQTIDRSDHSILQSRWNVITTVASPAYHRFDVVIDATKVKQPEWVGTDFSSAEIKKDWEYKSNDDRIGGPAYHFLAKKYFYTPVGTQMYLDSKVEPTERGRVEAQSGAYFDPLTNISGVWSGAYLDVE